LDVGVDIPFYGIPVEGVYSGSVNPDEYFSCPGDGRGNLLQSSPIESLESMFDGAAQKHKGDS
jgi:hypothetical protein